MKPTKAALVLPEGVRPGSLLTLTYEDLEFGPIPYHGIVLEQKRTKGKPLLMVLVVYWDDLPEYVAIDLRTGMQVGSISSEREDRTRYEVSRIELCDPDDILCMIGDEGYYDKGEPPTVSGGRVSRSAAVIRRAPPKHFKHLPFPRPPERSYRSPTGVQNPF